MSRPSSASRERAVKSSPRIAGKGKSGRVHFSNVAWWPQAKLNHREWASAGYRLGAIGRCSQWWIGDWIRYGTAQWGERYVEAARITGYDVASLRNMAWVASQFDELSLRSDKLTWSHHVLLAPLTRDEKLAWLRRALSEKLSVADLRIELRTARRRSEVPLLASEDDAPEAKAGHTDVICPQCGHRLLVPLGS